MTVPVHPSAVWETVTGWLYVMHTPQLTEEEMLSTFSRLPQTATRCLTRKASPPLPLPSPALLLGYCGDYTVHR